MMRIAILAGGLGTRLAERTDRIPKPMVEIGGRPILWHIMKGYSASGFDEFVVATGYRGDVIRRFFMDDGRLSADFTVHTASGAIEVHNQNVDDWAVSLVDTGAHTNTGGRLRRLTEWLPGPRFGLTYGDGVSDVDPAAVLAFHERHGKLATITAIRPPSRFGGLELEGDQVIDFTEKSQIGEGWINGGFMVLQREVLEMIAGDDSSFEADVLDQIAADGELMAYRHELFWHPMDTLRDVRVLESLWESDAAPWRRW